MPHAARGRGPRAQAAGPPLMPPNGGRVAPPCAAPRSRQFRRCDSRPTRRGSDSPLSAAGMIAHHGMKSSISATASLRIQRIACDRGERRDVGERISQIADAKACLLQQLGQSAEIEFTNKRASVPEKYRGGPRQRQSSPARGAAPAAAEDGGGAATPAAPYAQKSVGPPRRAVAILQRCARPTRRRRGCDPAGESGRRGPASRRPRRAVAPRDSNSRPNATSSVITRCRPG